MNTTYTTNLVKGLECGLQLLDIYKTAIGVMATLVSLQLEKSVWLLNSILGK
jgi:hypothetical protein